ncbi:MAG: hypothetical protein AVDCRST_MAG22-2013, partial [uncultured Rubrobacteraceae bacterium]
DRAHEDELADLRRRQAGAPFPGAVPASPGPQARRLRPREPLVPPRRRGAHRVERPVRLAAGTGLGERRPWSGYDRRRVLPGRPLDGPAGGKVPEALRTAWKGLREVARLGATLRLPDARAGDLRVHVRVLLAHPRRL